MLSLFYIDAYLSVAFNNNVCSIRRRLGGAHGVQYSKAGALASSSIMEKCCMEIRVSYQTQAVKW